MASYTPGPWGVTPENDLPGVYILDAAKREQEDWVNEGFDISDEVGDRRQEIADAHSAANARLIAAAPVLLMAAKQVEAWLTGGVKFVNQAGETTAEYPLMWLRAAIKKAEGGT